MIQATCQISNRSYSYAIAMVMTLKNLTHKMSGFQMSGCRIPTVVRYSLSGLYALWPDFQMPTKAPKPYLLKSVFERSRFWASGIWNVPVSTFFLIFSFFGVSFFRYFPLINCVFFKCWPHFRSSFIYYFSNNMFHISSIVLCH